jgi:hypothetical protein
MRFQNPIKQSESISTRISKSKRKLLKKSKNLEMLLSLSRMKSKLKIKSRESTGVISLNRRRIVSRRRPSKRKPRFHLLRPKLHASRVERTSPMIQSNKLGQLIRLRTSRK